MNLAKFKEYYSLGILTRCNAVPVDGGWILVVESDLKPAGYTLETALGQEKVYASLDSLNRDVQRVIGSPQSWSMML